MVSAISLNPGFAKTELNSPQLQNGDTLLHFAVRHHDRDLVDRACETVPVEQQNSEHLSAVDLAIALHDQEMGAFILQKRFGFDSQVAEGIFNDSSLIESIPSTFQYWRTKLRNSDLSLYTLDALKAMNPADYNRKDKNRLTPLHYAILTGQEDAIDYLLPLCDTSIRTIDGNTYLHFAAMTGNIKIVQRLLKSPIDVLSENLREQTVAQIWAFTSPSFSDFMELIKVCPQIQKPDLVSALSIFCTKAMRKSELVSSKDLWLSAFLATECAIALAFPDPAVIETVLVVSLVISKIFKNDFISTFAMAKSLSMVKSSSISYGVGLFVSTSLVVKVANDSFHNIKKCFQNIRYRPMPASLAAALHVFNASMVALPCFSEIFNLFQSKSEPDCPPPPVDTSLSPLERAANPGLKMQCVNHAKYVLGGAEFDDKEFDQSKCQYIQGLFRKMAMIIHPDKNADPRATTAFYNAQKARETLHCA